MFVYYFLHPIEVRAYCLQCRGLKSPVANAATKITAGIHDAVEEAISKSNQETALAVAEVKALATKVDKLTEALALIAQSTVASQGNRRPRRQRQDESKESSRESKRKSQEEEEPSPPPKKKPWRKSKNASAADANR